MRKKSKLPTGNLRIFLPRDFGYPKKTKIAKTASIKEPKGCHQSSSDFSALTEKFLCMVQSAPKLAAIIPNTTFCHTGAPGPLLGDSCLCQKRKFHHEAHKGLESFVRRRSSINIASGIISVFSLNSRPNLLSAQNCSSCSGHTESMKKTTEMTAKTAALTIPPDVCGEKDPCSIESAWCRRGKRPA